MFFGTLLEIFFKCFQIFGGIFKKKFLTKNFFSKNFKKKIQKNLDIFFKKRVFRHASWKKLQTIFQNSFWIWFQLFVCSFFPRSVPKNTFFWKKIQIFLKFCFLKLLEKKILSEIFGKKNFVNNFFFWKYHQKFEKI